MVAQSPSRGLALLLLVCSLGCCTGCSLVGFGIGSAVPRWESVPPEKIEGYRRPGRRLEVDVGLRPDASSPAPGRVVGAYGGFNGEDLVLVTYGETRVIPRRELHDVRVRTGSAWALGLVFGAVADVAFIAAAIVFVATYQPAISIGRW